MKITLLINSVTAVSLLTTCVGIHTLLLKSAFQRKNVRAHQRTDSGAIHDARASQWTHDEYCITQLSSLGSAVTASSPSISMSLGLSNRALLYFITDIIPLFDTQAYNLAARRANNRL